MSRCCVQGSAGETERTMTETYSSVTQVSINDSQSDKLDDRCDYGLNAVNDTMMLSST